MTTQPQRIAWSPRTGPNGTIGMAGTVGAVRMFTTWWIGGPVPYKLATSLPGFKARDWPFGTEEKARAHAEKLLAQWLRMTGLTAGPDATIAGQFASRGGGKNGHTL